MASTALGTKTIGSIVKLNVDGVAKNFIVVHQGKPSNIYDNSCDGTWLLMEDIYENRQWHSNNVNNLESSTIHSYLNSTFLDLFDANIRSQIKTVKLPYRKNGGSGGSDQSGANGLSCQVFLLSGYEVGWTTSTNQYFPVDGAVLDYFKGTSATDSKRIANLNGSATGWCLRSPYTDDTKRVWGVGTSGNYGGNYASYSYGIRPALVLPFNLLVSDDGAVTAETAPLTLGIKPIGSTIKLKRNGELKNFIVVQHGKPSASYDDSFNGGTWLLEEVCPEQRVWDADNVNKYETSDLDAYLNGDYLATFDSAIQSAIMTVKIPYRQNGGSGGTDRNGANGLPRKVFPLSGKEVGFTTASTNQYLPNDGDRLAYFLDGTGTDANNRRKTTYNGSATYVWLRSPHTGSTNYVWNVSSNGSNNYNSASGTYSIRPALVLPSDLPVLDDQIIGNTPPTTPGSIIIPEFIQDNNISVAWGESTDEDNNLAGYTLEHKIDSGEWTEIYRGRETNYKDNIASWTQLSYRVRAYDSENAYSDYAELALQSGDKLAIITTGQDTIYLPEIGEWELTIIKDGQSKTEVVNYLSHQEYDIEMAFVHIYGVQWDGTSTTKWTRTDDAALFTDPVPAVNNGTGNSPFDNLMPWAGMVKETRAGGVEVKEPKYWYKWTKTGQTLKLQIADAPVEGFYVDPVNMDRGDGLGELDFSYIGRYHCADNWKSETNKAQKCDVTRSAARSGIHGLGANFWQLDFAQFWYVNMLFLVEFADWNGERIGRGCSANNSKENNGKTDAMQYHTGTTAASRDEYGFTQYRNIEGWWDNVYDWMDGSYNTSSGLNVITNPSKYSDNANGVLVGLPVSGFPSDFAIPTQSGMEWALYPCAKAGSTTTYVPDGWVFNGSNPCLYHGGYNSGRQDHGPFCLYSNNTSYTGGDIGCRLWERPPKAA